MLKETEREIIEFIKYRQNATPEQIKKTIKKSFLNEKIYSEDIERLIMQAWKEMREESKQGRELEEQK